MAVLVVNRYAAPREVVPVAKELGAPPLESHVTGPYNSLVP